MTVLALKSNKMITPKLDIILIRMSDLLVTLFDRVQIVNIEIRCRLWRYVTAHLTVGVWAVHSIFQLEFVA